LVGCVMYPTSRVFYEPTASEGTLRNQTACGYLHTRDTVERTLGDVRIAVTVGAAKVPDNRQPTVEVVVEVEGPTTDSVNLRTERVLLVLAAPLATLHPSDLSSVSGQGSSSNRQFVRWKLTYPDPAGLSDKVEVSFEPGALFVHGRAIDVGPLHFNRVKRSDVYFGSINC
jgi:hypothetical protein